jgi:uncharacterized protein
MEFRGVRPLHLRPTHTGPLRAALPAEEKRLLSSLLLSTIQHFSPNLHLKIHRVPFVCPFPGQGRAVAALPPGKPLSRRVPDSPRSRAHAHFIYVTVTVSIPARFPAPGLPPSFNLADSLGIRNSLRYKGPVTSGYLPILREFISEQARPVDKFGHQPRLASLTAILGAGLPYDRDVVLAAAWLHDLGVFSGYRPQDPAALSRWDHVACACAHAPRILRDAGFPEEKIPAVLDVIRQHQPHDEPLSLEAVILRDADILEQLGAVGILRTVSKVGRDTRFPGFTAAVAVLRRNLDALPGRLRLDASRRLAQPRIRILEEFLAAVDAEAGPNLF